MILCILCFLSCGKDEPGGGSGPIHGGGGSGPEKIDATVRLNIFLPETSSARLKQLQNGFMHRFIVELHSMDKSVLHRTVVVEPVIDFSKASTELSVSLSPGTYKVAVWSDYVKKTQTDVDYHYNASSLMPVKINGDYSSNSEAKDCFAGSQSVSIANGDRASSVVNLDMKLHRPSGRVEFITTDMDKFLRDYDEGADYRIKITYPQYIATGFNVHDDVMKELKSAISYSLPLNVNSKDNRVVLSFDYLFAEANGSEFPAVVELLKDGKAIAATNVKIPVRRGENTIVSGEFLTSVRETSGGVSIDTGYDGEVNIDLGRI